MTIPIYQEHGRTYAADTCRPVVTAARAGRIRHAALARGHYPGHRLPRGSLAGIKSIGFWDAAHEQDWGLDWHCNEGLEITLLESGELGFAVDEHEVSLKPGDMTFTRPWQRHRVGDPHVSPGRLHFLILDLGVRRPHQSWRWPRWIVLDAEDLGELTDVLRHNEQPVWRAAADVRAAFQRIAAAVESFPRHGGISLLAVNVNQLLLALLEMFRRQDVPLDQSLSSAFRTAELFWKELEEDGEQLALEWTVREMARRCGLGTTAFTHYTKQLTNATPMRHLCRRRLAAAARLLREQPGRSVTDVALSVGFASSQYFATAFRAEYGQSPKAFRGLGS